MVFRKLLPQKRGKGTCKKEKKNKKINVIFKESYVQGVATGKVYVKDKCYTCQSHPN